MYRWHLPLRCDTGTASGMGYRRPGWTAILPPPKVVSCLMPLIIPIVVAPHECRPGPPLLATPLGTAKQFVSNISVQKAYMQKHAGCTTKT